MRSLTSSMIGYGIKFLEVQFLLPTAEASILGAISCLGGIFGMLGPLVWMRWIKPKLGFAKADFYDCKVNGLYN